MTYGIKDLCERYGVGEHTALGWIRSGELNAWARGIAAISRNRNVYCKLSGLATEADWQAAEMLPCRS